MRSHSATGTGVEGEGARLLCFMVDTQLSRPFNVLA